MTENELRKLLDQFLSLPAETEWIEFKEAKSNYDFGKIGKYFSALSNEANLKGRQDAWLIFGIEDKPRRIVGTRYRIKRQDLDNLKHEIASRTTKRITFTEIHELSLSEGRVLMFQIPAAPKGLPVAWEGHYYGREGRSLGALNIQEMEQIRSQSRGEDWSRSICPGAGIEDLDPAAIQKARTEYKQKNPEKKRDVEEWDDLTFLNKAKLTRQGQITRTAVILLGREESEHFISPAVAQITWTLKDENNTEKGYKDYEHFGPPFILNTQRVFGRVRNLRYRYLPDGTLFPIEITKYDLWVIREALQNCIAHQDYQLKGRINVVEYSDELVFTNVGTFLPGDVETVIRQDFPPEIYRNPFLAHAMVGLNMIDTIGGGIKKMFRTQMKRFFPLPDYDLTQPERVAVRIQGKVLNEAYTQLLINRPDMDLPTVMLLDKIQKGVRVSKEQHSFLKSKRLVEGRYPSLFLSSGIAAATREKAKYIRYRGFDDQYYKKMIIAFIENYGHASRNDVDTLLISKLPDALNDRQKRAKISNLLSAMSRRDGIIRNEGTNRKPKWVLCEE